MKNYVSIIIQSIFIILVFGVVTLNAQLNVNIPDPIFKNYLLSQPSINLNMDGEIQVTEAALYTGDIDIPNAGITSFTGLQAFISADEVFINGNDHASLNLTGMTSLTKIITNNSNNLISITFGSNTNLSWINANYCALTSINTTNLPALLYLHIAGNPITTLDLSNNPSLQVLSATGCNLSSLDVSNNSWLTEIYTVWNGNLQSLDLSLNPYLNFVNVSNCNLLSLNVANGNNTNLSDSEFRCTNNFNLYSVCVDDTAYSNNYWNSYVSPQIVFTDTCAVTPGMGLEEDLTNQIKVLNNPTQNYIYLSQPSSFILYTASGGILTQTLFDSVVDLNPFAPGIYYLYIMDTNHRFSIHKLVKY